MGSWFSALLLVLGQSSGESFWLSVHDAVQSRDHASLREQVQSGNISREVLLTGGRKAFLQGWAAEGMLDEKEALKAWERASRDDALRPYALRAKAGLFLKQGKKEEALESFLLAIQGPNLSSRFLEPCLLQAGELGLKLKRRENLPSLALGLTSIRSNDSAVPRILQEALREDLEQGLREQLEDSLLHDYPSSEQAKTHSLSLDMKTRPEHVFQAAVVLRRHRCNEESLALLESIENHLPESMKNDRIELRSRLLYALGKTSDAINLLEEHLSQDVQPSPVLSLLLPAWLEETGQIEKAILSYRDCLKGAEEMDFAWQAQWKRMEILRKTGREIQADEALEEIARKATSRWRAEALWKLCIEDLKKGSSSVDVLENRLEALAGLSERPLSAARACLFLAKTKEEESWDWFERIKKLQPAGCYFYHRALDLAGERGDGTRNVNLYLEKGRDETGLSFSKISDRLQSGPPLDSMGFVLPEPARFFWMTGMWELAVEAMEGSGLDKREGKDLYLLHSLKGAGLYHEGILLADRISSRGLRGQLLKELYPVHFEEYVFPLAANHGLDPRLIWAVIREESRFHSRARSPAGAMGLMQIMPATGEWIWEKRREGKGRIDLTDPEINIFMGIWYVKYLLDMYDGSLPLAIAGYNAGPGRVKRWIRELPCDDVDLFIESIPFQETRRYVQKVLGSYTLYCALYPR